MANWRDDVEGGYDFSFPVWAKYLEYIRGYDNGRIANALSPISTMFSPWKEIFPVITGIIVAFITYITYKFSDTDSPQSTISRLFLIGSTWALIILCLPWRDTLFVRDYSLNYLWAASVTLMFLWLIKRGERKGWKNPVFILALIFAVLAGGWHEGFAVATLCGLGCLMIVRRFRFSPQFYIVTAVYLVSTLLFMLSPGLIGRFLMSAGHDWPRMQIRTILILIIDLILLTIFYISTGKGYRRNISRQDVDFLTVSLGILISGYIISMTTVNTARSYFWPDLSAIGIAVWLIKNIISGMKAERPGKKTLLAALTCVIVICCTVQTVTAIVWQAKYTEETNTIMSLLDSSENGTVFYDQTLPPRPPLYTMDIPATGLWQNGPHYRCLWSYYMTPVLGVVPTALKEAYPASEINTFRGYIIGPYEQIDPEVSAKMPLYTGLRTINAEDSTITGHFLAIPFVSERGDTLLYYKKI